MDAVAEVARRCKGRKACYRGKGATREHPLRAAAAGKGSLYGVCLFVCLLHHERAVRERCCVRIYLRLQE